LIRQPTSQRESVRKKQGSFQEKALVLTKEKFGAAIARSTMSQNEKEIAQNPAHIPQTAETISEMEEKG
jgi:hypothetical protein